MAPGLLLCGPSRLYRRGAQGTGRGRDDARGRQTAAAGFAQAALSSEAFTPYADIGASASDGLALGDTYAALHTACMNDSGYGQYAASAPFEIRANRGLGFPQPYGPWGYLGLSLAAQYGFNAPAPVVPTSPTARLRR